MVLMFDKTADLSGMKAAYEAAVAAKWAKKPKGLRSPFRDGDEVDADGDRVKGPEYAGMTYVTLRAKEDRKPGVVRGDLSKINQNDGDFYPGCYAMATFSAYGYEFNNTFGVSFGLNNVQKVRDGDRLDSRADAEDDFEAIESPENKAMF
jgi:hypothetical protein